MGWIAALIGNGQGRTVLVENIGVGVFGAFIGGDFVVSLMNKGIVDDRTFKIGSLAWAIAGATVMLVVLRLLRHAVGPLKAGKRKPRNSS